MSHVGKAFESDPRSSGAYDAIVVESAAELLGAGDALGVWAEVRSGNGRRLRIGSPFVAKLVAADETLSAAYHAASPVKDRAFFTAAFAARIAALAAAAGNVADPDLHAKRLVTRLLPDVITLNPDRPIGFNFADRNGRHPTDDTASVVATVLAGRPTSQARTRYQWITSFPYFSPAA